jgi:hypothetical protein
VREGLRAALEGRLGFAKDLDICMLVVFMVRCRVCAYAA